MKTRMIAVLAGAALALFGGARAQSQTHVQLILDASGSMFAKLADGRSRITAAKDVLATLIGTLPNDPGLNVGLRVYGANVNAGQGGACEDSKLMVPMQGVDRAKLLETVRTVNARGATPIAYSLEQAAKDFPAGAGKKVIVLVTDGAESCRTDLKATAEALKAQGLDVQLHIVGIDLNERAAKSFEGLGTFENATSATTLLAALGRAVQVTAAPATIPVTVRLTRGGQPVADGPKVELQAAVGDKSYGLARGQNGAYTASVPGGAYIVKIDDALSNPPKLEFPGATVTQGDKNEFAYDLTPPPAVKLTVEGAGSASQAVTVKVEGAPVQAGQARHYVALALEGSPTGDYLAWTYVNGGATSVQLRTPEQPARLEARYYVDQPAGGTRVLGRSAVFETTQPKATVTAPAQVTAGSRFEVTFTGPLNSDDYIYLRKAGETSGYITYVSVGQGGKATMQAPSTAGDFEAVYMLRDREALAKSAKIAVAAAQATVKAPAQVQAGSRFEVTFTGPGNANDYIYLRKAGASGYITYAGVGKEGKVSLNAPTEPGEYEAAYALNDQEVIAKSEKIVVVAARASVTAPAQVVAGARFEVTFEGPKNRNDYIYIREEGQTSGYITYATVNQDGKVTMTAPLKAGNYVTAYALNDKEIIATSGRITVTLPTATITAPAQVKAGERFTVTFTGPFNAGDYIYLRKAGATSGYVTYATAGKDGKVTFTAPDAPGDYEAAYVLGDKLPIAVSGKITIQPK